MVLDPQFLLWMPYRCTIQQVGSLSTDSYGARVLSAGFSWQCRIEQESRLYVTKEGREVRCSATLFGPPYDASTGKVAIMINPTDKLTLPSGLIIAGSSQPPIITVLQHQDETETMYYEVLL